MGAHQRKVFLFKSLDEEHSPKPREGAARAMPSGGRGVVKVPSLLFDIELEDRVTEESVVDAELEESLQQLRGFVNPWTLIEQQLRRQVHEAYAESLKDGVKMDTHYLAEKLHLPGYHFTIRSALGGSDGGSCLQQLRHFFLTCTATGSPGGLTYVIDPCFREQFEIANPTEQYSTVLAEVPREFVGTEECVAKLVTLLSLQIKRSFQATGTTLPPWRHTSSMLSKWQPRRSRDIPVTSRPCPQSKSLVPNQHPEKEDGMFKVSNGGDGVRKTGLAVTNKPHATSPIQEMPNSGGKRGRGFLTSGKCSSLLAVKLRGVDTCRSPSAKYQTALFSGRSKA